MKTIIRIVLNMILISIIGLVFYKYKLAKDELVITWVIYFYGFSIIAPLILRTDRRQKKDYKKQFICNIVPMGVALFILILLWIKTEDEFISKKLYLILALCCGVYSIYSWLKFKKRKADIKTKALGD